jgi:protoporphyrinogen oxidase
MPSVAKPAPTSLVERFLYPRLGPGQLWETVARQIQERGGEIRLSQRAEQIERIDGRVTAVTAHDLATGTSTSIAADWVISTMAVSDLIAAIQPPAPANVSRIAAALPYRHFIVVGVLATRMKPRPGSPFVPGTNRLPDNWIYVQEPDVKMGRLQIFNNWSPALVPDPDKVWLGVEYFCSDTDALWSMSDAAIQALAVRELAQIELVDAQDVEAATVVRVPKAYPAYFGSYAQFDSIRSFVDPIENLFLVGRNGMHRYNNQDHSMLTAKAAVDIIVAGRGSKDTIWGVNVDDDYHESIND